MFKKFSWLPLTGLIFGTYMIQRGLASLAKAGIAPHLQDATSIFFTVAGIAVFFMGMLCDNIKSKTMIAVATILGSAGILFLPSSALMFGLFFGVAAAILKIIPFSNPLKLTDGNDSIRIAPQASAKNFGAAIFILLIGSLAGTLGLVPLSFVFVTILMLIGIWAYFSVEDEIIHSWNIKKVLELTKKPLFWFFMMYSFIMVGTYYVAVSEIYPMLTRGDVESGMALTVLGVSFIVAGILRWPWAWIGHKTKYIWPMIVGTLGLVGSVFLLKANFILGVPVFIIFGSAHTPNYWAYAKEKFGPELLATVLGLAYVAMYLGAGIIYGKW